MMIVVVVVRMTSIDTQIKVKSFFFLVMLERRIAQAFSIEGEQPSRNTLSICDNYVII